MTLRSRQLSLLVVLLAATAWGEGTVSTLEHEGILVEVVKHPLADSDFVAETLYRIGPDDLLRLTIHGDFELSGNYYVDAEGYLNLPYLEAFPVAGLTVREARQRLLEAWAPYLGRLPLGLDVVEYNSCQVYILGEVGTPGLYSYRARISLLEALARAGGLKPHAVGREVAVVRVLPEVTRLYLVDVDGIVRRGEAMRDIPLAANDIVYVPRSFIGDWNQFLTDIGPTLRLVFEANRLYRLYW